MHSLRLQKPYIKGFTNDVFQHLLQRQGTQTIFTISVVSFHKKLDISHQESWDISRVLLICSRLAVSQLAHYGGRLLMKLKAGCGDNYSYRQISCCSESITMSSGCDGDLLQIFLMINNEVINMAALCYLQWGHCRCSHFEYKKFQKWVTPVIGSYINWWYTLDNFIQNEYCSHNASFLANSCAEMVFQLSCLVYSMELSRLVYLLLLYVFQGSSYLLE